MEPGRWSDGAMGRDGARVETGGEGGEGGERKRRRRRMRDADQWVFHRHNDSVDATLLSVSIAATNTVSRQGPSDTDTLHNSAACHFSQVSFLCGVISQGAVVVKRVECGMNREW